MAHPLQHCKSSVKKWGGKVEDYLHIHNWFDETKAWVGHSKHRMFRHHSEGIFECEKIFGASFVNSDGKTDLIIGIPGKDIPATPTTKIIKDAGAVQVVSGASL